MVQKLQGLDFFEESDVVAEVCEECVFDELFVREFLGVEQVPQVVGGFFAGARRGDAEAVLANEFAGFGMEVGGGFFEQVLAAAADGEFQVVAP